MKDESLWSDRGKQASANYTGNIKVTAKTELFTEKSHKIYKVSKVEYLSTVT